MKIFIRLKDTIQLIFWYKSKERTLLHKVFLAKKCIFTLFYPYFSPFATKNPYFCSLKRLYNLF